jgi:hypothetical protein
MIRKLIKNNIYNITSNFFIDKKGYLVNLYMKSKLIITVENKFKIFSYLEFRENEGHVLIHKSGKILYFSKKFSEIFYFNF